MITELSQLWLNSPREAPPLRIGVLLDSWQLPRCFAGVLKDVRDSNFAQLTTVILNDEPAEQRPILARVGRALTRRETRQHALYAAYDRFVEPRFRMPDDPLESEDCAQLLAGASRIPVVPERKNFVHRFPRPAVLQVRSERLDVILRFGFNLLRGEILEAARCGVWSYHHGDNEFYRGLPPAFWELAEGNPVTGVILQRLTEELDGGLRLACANFATKGRYSAARNRWGPFWGSRHFVIQKLLELHRDGWDAVARRASVSPPYKGHRPLYRKPTNADMLNWLGRRIVPSIAERLRDRSDIETWHLGLRRSATPLYAAPPAAGSSGFEWIVPPRGRFWADPFLAESDGQLYLFFEDYSFATRKGVIACAPVDTNGRLGPVEQALERPYHLSYPLVLRHHGETFMVPETADAGVVEIYRARRFPTDWVLETALLRIAGLDSTPVFAHGRWWMYTTPDLGGHHAPFTLLYSAPDLLGPWRHHVESPISSDVRLARSAGSVIQVDGRTIRVSQDCAGGYGRRLAFSEITELSERSYHERVIGGLDPSLLPNQTGVHTYNRLGDWEVIDVKVRLPRRDVL